MEISLGVPTIADLSWGHAAAMVALILLTTIVTRSANAGLDLAKEHLAKAGGFLRSAAPSRWRSLIFDFLLLLVYVSLIFLEVSDGDAPTKGSVIWLVFLCAFGIFAGLNVLWDIAMIAVEKERKK